MPGSTVITQPAASGPSTGAMSCTPRPSEWPKPCMKYFLHAGSSAESWAACSGVRRPRVTSSPAISAWAARFQSRSRVPTVVRATDERSTRSTAS